MTCYCPVHQGQSSQDSENLSKALNSQGACYVDHKFQQKLLSYSSVPVVSSAIRSSNPVSHTVGNQRLISNFKRQEYQAIDPRGKWTPAYEGLCMIKKIFSSSATTLSTMDGEDLPHPVNPDIVKKYYT